MAYSAQLNVEPRYQIYVLSKMKSPYGEIILVIVVYWLTYAVSLPEIQVVGDIGLVKGISECCNALRKITRRGK